MDHCLFHVDIPFPSAAWSRYCNLPPERFLIDPNMLHCSKKIKPEVWADDHPHFPVSILPQLLKSPFLASIAFDYTRRYQCCTASC
jgi:hypothetical protein